jgi:hypothetical protein
LPYAHEVPTSRSKVSAHFEIHGIEFQQRVFATGWAFTPFSRRTPQIADDEQSVRRNNAPKIISAFFLLPG